MARSVETVTHEVHESILHDGKFERAAVFKTYSEALDHVRYRRSLRDKYQPHRDKPMLKILRVRRIEHEEPMG